MFHPGLIDPRPDKYRQRASTLDVRDLKDFARWELHLSDIEFDSLVRQNPDTLGHPDARLRQKYWHTFTSHPASRIYRVRR